MQQEAPPSHKSSSSFLLHKTVSESSFAPSPLFSPKNFHANTNSPLPPINTKKAHLSEEKEALTSEFRDDENDKSNIQGSEHQIMPTDPQTVTPLATIPDSLVTLNNDDRVPSKRVLRFKVPEKRTRPGDISMQNLPARSSLLMTDHDGKSRSFVKIMPDRLDVPLDKTNSLDTQEGPGRRGSSINLTSQNRLSMFKASVSTSKTKSATLTFDAFVDKQKGVDPPVKLESDYPSYKIDKRLIFLGEDLEYPALVVPYASNLRKIWNLFIVAFIMYGALLYPLIAVFSEHLSAGLFAVEIITIFVFVLDILINMRTTYSNENNEEIIDSKMMRDNYMKSPYFILDVVTCFPISEILLGVISDSDRAHAIYDIFKLIRLFRLLKVGAYLKNMSLSPVFGLLRTFISFCIMVHWMSCIWYSVIKSEYHPDMDFSQIWFPPDPRATIDNEEELLLFYEGSSMLDVYMDVLLSVFMLMIGGDIVPITFAQECLAIFIGFTGAVALAYIFGSVTFIISYLNAEETFYQEKLSDLTKKLAIGKYPQNLRIKAMEYFHYSWRKNRILQKSNDFSELSIPLQRDLAFYQHQGSIMKVPLFRELEPIEILSIIQKLKTCVYMPGDKIIREGEKGNEMFFIQEGKVEILIKKPTVKPDGQKEINYERICLDKGSYFGEISLISTSKRTSDVNAYEFCILDSFSKADYESLKVEFPDIGPRLKAGLKHYKNNHMEKLIQILGRLDLFEGFTNKELRIVADKYVEEIFINPERLVLRPKEKTNSIYVILLGSITCYPDRMETRNYLASLANTNKNKNNSVPEIVEEIEQNQDCVDDNILEMEKDQLTMNDQKKKLRVLKTFSYGEYFGKLDFEVNNTSCKDYYISDSGCQLGIINQALLGKMDLEDPDLFEKMKANVLRNPDRDRGSLEDEGMDNSKSIGLAAGVRRRIEKFKTNMIQQRKKKEFANKEQVEKIEEKIDKLLHIMQRSEVKQTKRVASQNRMNKMFMKKIPRKISFRRPVSSVLSIEEAVITKTTKLNYARSLKQETIEQVPSLQEKEEGLSSRNDEDEDPFKGKIVTTIF